MSPSSLGPCSSCGRFRKIADGQCPHCGSGGTFPGRSTRAALIGLAIGGSFACVTEAKYGMAADDAEYWVDTGDTGDTAESEDDTRDKN